MGLAAQIREGSGKHTKEPGISQSTGKPSRSTHRNSLVSKKVNATTIAAEDLKIDGNLRQTRPTLEPVIVRLLGGLEAIATHSLRNLNSKTKERSNLQKVLDTTTCKTRGRQPLYPGIVETVRMAKNLMKDDVLLVMGGFHLRGDDRIELKTTSRFRDLGVKYVGSCHCTGEIAKGLFKEEYGDHFITVGVGRKITLEDLE